MCNPNPCGANADCSGGQCTCIPEYQGDPYQGCRPECLNNADCNRDKACIRYKCVDPCINTCAQNAKCDVVNHIPVCFCSEGFTGDPFTNCKPFIYEDVTQRPEPCGPPSPCGPNSACRNINDHAVCSCLTGYIGAPPQCRPECVIQSECQPNQACVNKKCIDPCIGKSLFSNTFQILISRNLKKSVLNIKQRTFC